MTDQAPLDTNHVAIGYRSMLLALARLVGSHILFFFSFAIANRRLITRCSQAALARTSALLLAQKDKKPTPAKKIRGHKAAELKASLE